MILIFISIYTEVFVSILHIKNIRESRIFIKNSRKKVMFCRLFVLLSIYLHNKRYINYV